MKTKLPKGAAVLNPTLKKEVGHWVEQEFDATVKRGGVIWYRVKDGFGGRGDREDWVACVPGISISIHDYQYRAPYWGSKRYGSFDQAIAGEMKEAVERINGAVSDLKAKLAIATEARALILKSLKARP